MLDFPESAVGGAKGLGSNVDEVADGGYFVAEERPEEIVRRVLTMTAKAKE